MKSEKKTSKLAKILYRPWGLVASLLGGLVAGQIFQQVWNAWTPTAQRTRRSRWSRSTDSERSSSQPSSKAPSSPRFGRSSIAAAPGPSNAGPANGPVTDQAT